MPLVGQGAGNPADIMIINKAQQMFSFIQGPVLRTKLTQKRMNDLKHIHAVKAGIQTLIAFVVGSTMAHLIIYELVVVAVKQFP